MRYTIIINNKDDPNIYSASVLELPGCETNGFKNIEEAITEVKKNIEQFNGDNRIKNYFKKLLCIDKLLKCPCIDKLLKYFCFDGHNHSDVVFNPSSDNLSNNSTTYYYYTFDDKRDSLIYLIIRLVWLLFWLLVVYSISCRILGTDWGFCLNVFKKDGIKLTDVLEAFFSILSILITIWAMQSYWRLRYIDKQAEKWRPHNKSTEDEWSSPFTFHVLAESHKQWAELWFCWCVAIFTGGMTYAIFKVIDHTEKYQRTIENYTILPPSLPSELPSALPWTNVAYDLFSAMAPNGFIYLLFGVAWFWSSKHYRSHWHNFVINAYRHRALWRLQKLREEIHGQMNEKYLTSALKAKAEETILELYRLSGVLLLIPGDSSYLDKVGSEEITKTLLQMEEITKAFPSQTSTP